MRLDDFDPNAVDIEDQRGSGGSGMGMPIGGRGGSIGCGTIIIALIAYFVFGVDPGQMIGGIDQAQQQMPQAQVQAQGGSSVGESCNIDAMSKQTCNALSSLNKTWEPVFQQAGLRFARPKLVFYSQAGRSGCGAAQSAMGPFYCPEDQGIYIDTDFYKQMDRELGASGEFARYYVIAHEYGHHMQKLTGMSDQVRSAQGQNPRQANQLSVQLELQADCYAGVWAAKNRNLLEPGDMESGLNAAQQIGDDVLMRNAGRRVSPESFTHGSAQQRMTWLRNGMQSGDDTTCDALFARQ
jgi:uncharacterized protein